MKKRITTAALCAGMSAFRRIFISSLGAVALLLPSIGQAQETWTFDPTFQRTPLRVTSESAYAVKVLRSGKVLTYSINGGLMSGANGQRDLSGNGVLAPPPAPGFSAIRWPSGRASRQCRQPLRGGPR